jgi:hypothetical protein
MDQREPDFGERYQEIWNSPPQRRARALGLWRALCMLALLPFGLGAVMICERFGLRGSTYIPIIIGISTAIATLLSPFLMRWDRDRAHSTKSESGPSEPIVVDSSSWTGR